MTDPSPSGKDQGMVEFANTLAKECGTVGRRGFRLVLPGRQTKQRRNQG